MDVELEIGTSGYGKRKVDAQSRVFKNILNSLV